MLGFILIYSDFVGCVWILSDFVGFNWTLLDFLSDLIGFCGDCLGFVRFRRDLLALIGSTMILSGLIGFYSDFIGFCLI